MYIKRHGNVSRQINAQRDSPVTFLGEIKNISLNGYIIFKPLIIKIELTFKNIVTIQLPKLLLPAVPYISACNNIYIFKKIDYIQKIV